MYNPDFHRAPPRAAADVDDDDDDDGDLSDVDVADALIGAEAAAAEHHDEDEDEEEEEEETASQAGKGGGAAQNGTSAAAAAAAAEATPKPKKKKKAKTGDGGADSDAECDVPSDAVVASAEDMALVNTVSNVVLSVYRMCGGGRSGRGEEPDARFAPVAYAIMSGVERTPLGVLHQTLDEQQRAHATARHSCFRLSALSQRAAVNRVGYPLRELHTASKAAAATPATLDAMRGLVVVLWPEPMPRALAVRAARNQDADERYNGLAYDARPAGDGGGRFVLFRRTLVGRASRKASSLWLPDAAALRTHLCARFFEPDAEPVVARLLRARNRLGDGLCFVAPFGDRGMRFTFAASLPFVPSQVYDELLARQAAAASAPPPPPPPPVTEGAARIYEQTLVTAGAATSSSSSSSSSAFKIAAKRLASSLNASSDAAVQRSPPATSPAPGGGGGGGGAAAPPPVKKRARNNVRNVAAAAPSSVTLHVNVRSDAAVAATAPTAPLTREAMLGHLRALHDAELRDADDVFAPYRTLADLHADPLRGRWALLLAHSFTRRFLPELLALPPPPLNAHSVPPPLP